MNEIKDIFIEPTKKAPLIDFNHTTGDLIISGKSIPENVTKIYEPLHKWVCSYVNNPRQTTNLRLNLEYFNTATYLWLAKIVKTLSRMENPDNVLFIHHYFDIEDYDNMDTEDIKETLISIFDVLITATISIGVKIYGTDENGKILKESTILF